MRDESVITESNEAAYPHSRKLSPPPHVTHILSHATPSLFLSDLLIP